MYIFSWKFNVYHCYTHVSSGYLGQCQWKQMFNFFFNLRVGYGPVRANLSAHSPTWTDLVALDLESKHSDQGDWVRAWKEKNCSCGKMWWQISNNSIFSNWLYCTKFLHAMTYTMKHCKNTVAPCKIAYTVVLYCGTVVQTTSRFSTKRNITREPL